MISRSPGKIILSGEYAVVYGRPAIAVAVDRFVETVITDSKQNNFVTFYLDDLGFNSSISFDDLIALKYKLNEKYQLFLNGKCDIKNVLTAKNELAYFASANILHYLFLKLNTQNLENLLKIKGFSVHVKSSIPVGCGMGSSAALILSITNAVALWFGVTLSHDEIINIAYESERLQHGFTSKTDLKISLNGNGIFFDNGFEYAFKKDNMQLYLVNTGTPISSTGECVKSVDSRNYKSEFWGEFESVTRLMYDKLVKSDNIDELMPLVKKNNQLLDRIQVVPKKVREFIIDLENIGNAAKICGAGSVCGDAGGIVLAITKNPEKVYEICVKYGYEFMKVFVTAGGLNVL